MRAARSPPKAADRRSPGIARGPGEDHASRRVAQVVGSPEGESSAPRAAPRATPDKTRVVAFGSSSPSLSPGKENSPGGSRRVTPSRSAEQMRRVEAACARAGVASPGDSSSRRRVEDEVGESQFRVSPEHRSSASPLPWSPSSSETCVTPQSAPREVGNAPQPSPRVMPSAMLRSAVEAAAEASVVAEAAADASFESARRLDRSGTTGAGGNTGFPAVASTSTQPDVDPLRSILGYLDAVDLEYGRGNLPSQQSPTGRPFSVAASVAAVRATYNEDENTSTRRGVADRVLHGFSPKSEELRVGENMAHGDETGGAVANESLRVAAEAYRGVKSRMEELRNELSRRDVLIRKLEAELRVSYDRAAAQTAVQLAEQRASHETQTARHLNLVETLLADKAALADECARLSEALSLVEARHAHAFEQQRQAFVAELKNKKAKWEQGRVQWETEKTAEVKELTIRGLEPEIQRLVQTHRLDVKNRENEWREQARVRDLQVRAQHEDTLLELKTSLKKESHAALESERDAARVALDDATSIHAQKVTELRRQQSQRDVSSSEQFDAGRNEERKSSAHTIKQLTDEAAEREDRYEKNLAAQRSVTEKRHAAELRALQLRLDEESNTFKSRVAAKARESVKQRELEIVAASELKLNKEIEAVSLKLKLETTAGRHDADQKLAERAERAERDVERSLERISTLTQEVQTLRDGGVQDYRVAALTSQLEMAEGRAHVAEDTLSRDRTRRDVETSALEHRVRLAIGQKDETIAKLVNQLRDLRGLLE